VQSLYALKLLRNHGICDDLLRHVYKTVILSKLLYASPAWWGFTSAGRSIAFKIAAKKLQIETWLFQQLIGSRYRPIQRYRQLLIMNRLAMIHLLRLKRRLRDDMVLKAQRSAIARQ